MILSANTIGLAAVWALSGLVAWRAILAPLESIVEQTGEHDHSNVPVTVFATKPRIRTGLRRMERNGIAEMTQSLASLATVLDGADLSVGEAASETSND